MSKPASMPDPSAAAISGIRSDQELQPFNYLINAASTMGQPITIDGKTYNFSGLGAADTASKVSDQMARTLLALKTEKDPAIIQQRIDELKAADPQGYAARQTEFDKIIAYSKANPGIPLSNELQQSLQDQLAKGVGFDDAKQEQEVREGVRGDQVSRGIYLGNAPASEEGKAVVNAGESLQSQRQQNALDLLQSGQDPNNLAYQQFEQSLANLGAFANQQTPEAQFRQVSGAGQGPVRLTGGAPGTGFDPGAANRGLDQSLGIYSGNLGYEASQANPWLAGTGIATSGLGALAKINPSWFKGSAPSLTWDNSGQTREMW